MRVPRSGAWRVYSRTPGRKLIACWAGVFIVDPWNTETDECGREKIVERVSRPVVRLHRVPGSVPIVVPKNRSTFLRWPTVEKFQRRAGFIAARIEVQELNKLAHERFSASWNELKQEQCLEILVQIGKEER